MDDMVKNYPLVGDEQVFYRIGETPITGVGYTWLPVTQLITWGIFSRMALRKNPDRSRIAWSIEGFLRMIVVLGSEWFHNLAHLLSSNLINKPMDQMRIQLGMPRCIYYQLNDESVSPRQHLIRALGGPIINLLLLPLGWLGKKLTREDSIAGQTAKTFFLTNLFLSLVSFLPVPGIDGGPILKWSLVEKGKSIREADEVVKQINGPLSVGLGLFSSWAFLKRKPLLGFFGMMLGGISLAIFAGWLKEEDVSF